jgi:hypothetical protein
VDRAGSVRAPLKASGSRAELMLKDSVIQLIKRAQIDKDTILIECKDLAKVTSNLQVPCPRPLRITSVFARALIYRWIRRAK